MMTTGWMKSNRIDGTLEEGCPSGERVNREPQAGTGDEEKTRFPIEEGAVEEARRREIKVIVSEENALIGKSSRGQFGKGCA